jgi:hypothetical protein
MDSRFLLGLAPGTALQKHLSHMGALADPLREGTFNRRDVWLKMKLKDLHQLLCGCPALVRARPS